MKLRSHFRNTKAVTSADHDTAQSETMSFDHILGNASDEVKRKLGAADYAPIFGGNAGRNPIFGHSIAKRMTVTEISIERKAEEPQKSESRVVCEVTVEDGLLLC